MEGKAPTDDLIGPIDALEQLMRQHFVNEIELGVKRQVIHDPQRRRGKEVLQQYTSR